MYKIFLKKPNIADILYTQHLNICMIKIFVIQYRQNYHNQTAHFLHQGDPELIT